MYRQTKMNNKFELSKMITNEEKRVSADREIPLREFDVLYEILGNMYGNEIRIWNNKNELITYVSDNGFSQKDKEAICEKNLSGDNDMTVGKNGLGVRLVTDRILPQGDDKHSTIYSLSDKKKGAIGHFTVTQPDKWLDIDENDEQYISKFTKNKTGTFTVIPLSDKWDEDLKKDEEKLKKACNKFLSNKIADKKTRFFWNNEEQIVDKVCKDEGCIQIEYTLGYDTNTRLEDLDNNHKLPLIIKIDNYEELTSSLTQDQKKNIHEYTHTTHKEYKKHDIKNNFQSFEEGKLRLNIEKTTDNYYPVGWIDGINVCINDCLINLTAHTRYLGGKTEHGVFETKNNIYGGKPRFENKITKNSRQYSIPVDKTNIQPTTKGITVHRFIRNIAQSIFKPKKSTSKSRVNNPTNKLQTESSTVKTEQTIEAQPELNMSANTYIEDTEQICNVIEKKRNNFSHKTIKDEVSKYAKHESMLYKDCPYYDKNIERCIMCDIICSSSDKVAGHIQSDKEGGMTDAPNCLMICPRCNNCDTMLIPERTIKRYGINHPITKRLEQYMILTNKDHKEYFENYRNKHQINSIPAIP